MCYPYKYNVAHSREGCCTNADRWINNGLPTYYSLGANNGDVLQTIINGHECNQLGYRAVFG